MGRLKRWGVLVAVLALAALALVVPQPPTASAASVVSPGPLSTITISPDLNCDVRYVGDTSAEWYGSTACGTFLSINGTLYGPASVPAGSGASPITAWTRVSQSAVSGSGTDADPFQLVTVVRAGSTGVTLRQTDSYVVGSDQYDTSVVISNGSGTTQLGNLYTAGDCYLQNSDSGYGKVFGSSPACTSSTSAGSRIEQLLPRTGGNAYMLDRYSNVWAWIGTQRPFPNTCATCTTYVDNGEGISWPVSIGAGGDSTYAWSTVFSPTGNVPVVVSVTAHRPTVLPSGSDGYTIRVSNGNVGAAIVDEVTLTLPPGFTYTPGSTTGATTADPTISGSTLTFSGPFTVPSNGVLQIDIGVTASATAGTYTVDADATSPTFPVSGATNSAPITVLGVTDLAITKTAASSTVVAGGTALVFRLTVTNVGSGTATGIRIADTPPNGMTFTPTGSTPGCFLASGVVTCSVADLAPGASANVDVALTALSTALPGARSNTAVVSADVDDTNLLNNSASAPFSVVRQSDVSVTKSGPAVVAPGANVTYTMTVRNAGPSSADIALSDLVAGGLSVVSLSGAGSCSVTTATCSLSLASGGAATLTLVGRTSSALPDGGTVSNTATVTTTSTDPNAANDSATTTATVQRSADLRVQKRLLDDAIVAGRSARYEVVVTNLGPSQATDVVVVDTLPPEAVLDPSQSSPACSAAGSTVTCAAGTVDAGPTPGTAGLASTFVIAFEVPAGAEAGTALTNSATVAGSESDPAPANNTVTVESDVTRQVDLAVTKTSTDEPAAAGGPVTYAMTVTNRGPSQASDVVLTDPAIDGATWQSATVTGGAANDCSVTGGDLTCTVPVLPVGDTVTVTLVGEVDDPSALVELENTVTVTSAEPEVDDADNVATETTDVTATSGLDVAKSDGVSSVVAGGPISYTITAINRGPSTAPGVSLVDVVPATITDVSVDPLPAGVTCEIVENRIACSLGSLPPDLDGSDPVVITVTGTVASTVAAGTSLTNTAELTDDLGGENRSTEITPVTQSSALSVVKTPLAGSVVAGGTVQWSVELNNAGPSVTTGSVLLEAPDPGVRVTSITGGATCVIASLRCDLPAILPGVPLVLTVTGTVDPSYAADTLGNAVTVLDPHGEDAGDTTTVDVTRSADLVVTKLADPATVIPGEDATYRVTVRNDGPSTATDVTVTDTLPAGLTFLPDSSSDGCSAAGQVVTCDVGRLAVGDLQRLTLVASSSAALDGPLDNTLTAGGVEDDPTPATATATTDFEPAADLSLTKSGTSVLAGRDITWTLVVDDQGPSTATGVVVRDRLPDGTTFRSATASDGSVCSHADGVVTCALADLSPGAPVTVTIVVATDPDSVPVGQLLVSVSNVATVAATTPDDDPADNAASGTAVIAAGVDLAATKTGPSTAVAGTRVTYVVGASNAGPSTASAVTVSDVLPADLQFVPEASDPSCRLTDRGTNTVTCTSTGLLPPGEAIAFDVVALVGPSVAQGSVLTDTASAEAFQPDLAPELPATVRTLVTASADVSVTKSASASVVAAGAPLTYTVVIRNAGPSSAVGITFSDGAPALLRGGLRAGAKGSPACPVVGVSFECAIPELLPGESLTLRVPVTTDPGTPDGTTVTNTIEVASKVDDPDLSNNSDDATVRIDRESTLSVSKSADVRKPHVGDEVTWTLVVSNDGPSVSDAVRLADTLPDGLELVAADAPCEAGQSDGGATVVTCDVGGLDPGESVALAVRTRVADDATGDIVNTVTASAEGAAGATASARITVSPDETPTAPPSPTPAPGETTGEPPIAATGTEAVGPAVLAGILVVSGGVLWLLARRRSRGSTL
ncbi:DUF11 domain-containing protein [Cellulomonas rhizosphaerae]|uniref:DUF11 domain-containing protein n=1 Tax=Cellulomonas rhizosphaerae TaxID=2293719 RepID=A0A413RNR6_9CELL|nr:DUF11 domain-containing protein [Cellulomonas rhizosphaerae]RHA43551.1 DUF11 domain-containing protein [Cellulomonas rhizosphaerae]